MGVRGRAMALHEQTTLSMKAALMQKTCRAGQSQEAMSHGAGSKEVLRSHSDGIDGSAAAICLQASYARARQLLDTAIGMRALPLAKQRAAKPENPRKEKSMLLWL